MTDTIKNNSMVIQFTIKSVFLGLKTDKDGWKHNAYHVVLGIRGSNMDFTYRMGTGIKGEPCKIDVLYSIISDLYTYSEGMSFDNFCSEYGYDTDSKKAEQTYDQIIDQSKQFIGMINSPENSDISLDGLRELFEDY
jgi:hypothetical protein